MKLTVIGTGYVGLVSGVCFADFGHDVTCVDIDESKIAALKNGHVPIYEPGLDVVLERNVTAGRLHFTTDLGPTVAASDAVFIAVGTPTRRGDGHADMRFVHQAARDIAAHLHGFTVVVTKSTVPVGSAADITAILAEAAPNADVEVASNPEFLREGAAIEDFMRPDRVVVGVNSPKAREVMAEIYRPLSLRDAPVMFTDPASAELIKYAANAFLATKISFINEIAQLCDRTGANVQAVAKGMGLDNRIGSKFLHPGPGYGGSCFPKDTQALARIGQDHSTPMTIVETVIRVNEDVKRSMVDKILDLMGGTFAGKRIAVLGVTFKPNTDDMRDAPSLTIVPALVGGGADVHACDPEGAREGTALLPSVTWHNDPYDAARGADVVILLTEWNSFRALDLPRLKDCMAGTGFADLRNVYPPADVVAAGFDYISLGRPTPESK